MQNLSMLVIGKDYTYKQMCEILNEEAKTGNSKYAQLARWEQYMALGKIKRGRYQILEIYETPSSAKDNRRNNGGNATSKYSYLDDKIMEALEDKEKIVCTISKLAETIDLLSSRYNVCSRDTKAYCEENHLHEALVREYLNCIRRYVNRSIESSLKRLTTQGYINAKKNIVLSTPNGKITLNDHKRNAFLEMEASTLKSMGKSYSDLSDIGVVNALNHTMLKFAKDEWGIYAVSYYREYTIVKLKHGYQPSEIRLDEELSLKFIVMIAYRMLIYIHSEGEHTIGTKTGELIDNGEELLDKTELYREVIDLSIDWFTHIKETSWRNLIDILGDDNGKNKKIELVFFSYCFSLMFRNSHKNTSKKTVQATTHRPKTHNSDFEIDCTPYMHLSTEACRQAAIIALGEEDVEKCEYILPKINWKKICTDIDYMMLYAEAIKYYENTKALNYYYKGNYVEEFSIYCARMYAAGLEDKIIYQDVFEKDPTKYLAEQY